MWIRKSEEQISSERNHLWLSLRGPAVLFLICFLAGIGIAVQGPRSGGDVSWPHTWFEVLRNATSIAMIAAIIGYVLQLVLRKKLNPLANHAKIVICDTCYRVKHRDCENKCECGGTFDDLDNWTWID